MVRTVDGVHRLLVLKVPPRGVTCGEARKEHASRRTKYRDHAHGSFVLQLRVKEAFTKSLSSIHEESHGNDYLNGGRPIHLVERPARYDLMELSLV